MLFFENKVTCCETLGSHGDLFQDSLSSQFPTADKPLKSIILSTEILLGTNNTYVQQEVDFDYYTAL